jgi:uncharacterized membrane protein
MATWLARLFWTLATAYAGLVVWAAGVLPERVPMHWSGTGPPDRWGSRTETTVMLVVLGVIMVGTFGLMLVFIPRSRSLAWVNLPNKWYWEQPERLPETFHRIKVDLGVLGCLAVAFSGVVPLTIVEATLSDEAVLPAWSVAAFVGWLALFLGYTIWMVVVRYRVPPEARP